MHFFSTTTTTTALFLGALLATGTTAQKLNKRELTPQSVLDPYYAKFNTLLPAKSYTFSTWNKRHVPTSCVTHAQDSRHPCPLDQLQAYSVKYSDCSKVWNICRCASSPQSRDSMFQLFGRLPVGARSHVRIFMGMAPWTGIAAYASPPDMASVSAVSHMGTLIHEVAHVIDGNLGWVSQSTEFKSAVDADSCVLVAYGNTNYVENFAVMANLVMLEMIDNTAFSELKGRLENFNCLAKGLAVVRKYLRPVFLPQATCPARVPGDGTSVYVRRRRNLEGVRVGQVSRKEKRQEEVSVEEMGVDEQELTQEGEEEITRVVLADPIVYFENGTGTSPVRL